MNIVTVLPEDENQGQEYKHVLYNLKDLNLTRVQFLWGLEYLDPLYSYIFISENEFKWFGKIMDNGLPEFDNYPLPPSNLIIEGAEKTLQNHIDREKVGQPLWSHLKTISKGFVFKTCHDYNHTSCVEILPNSNSVSCVIDDLYVENKTVANTDEYIDKISSLPIYHYNLINQDPNTKPRLFCLPEDWNKVFPSKKDLKGKSIEVNDVIGVLLLCVKDLNQRVRELENTISTNKIV